LTASSGPLLVLRNGLSDCYQSRIRAAAFHSSDDACRALDAYHGVALQTYLLIVQVIVSSVSRGLQAAKLRSGNSSFRFSGAVKVLPNKSMDI
jgi:hypothetical protein